jgi:hypothetical protein
VFDSIEKTKEQLNTEAAQGRSPDQIAALRWAAVLLVVNVFLVLLLALVFHLERIPLLSIIVALALARHLYKLRPGTETITLGLAALATVVAPLMSFWRLPMGEAFFESVAVWGMTGPLFLLLLGDPARSRRIAAVAVFCVFRVGIYALAAMGHVLVG